MAIVLGGRRTKCHWSAAWWHHDLLLVSWLLLGIIVLPCHEIKLEQRESIIYAVINNQAAPFILRPLSSMHVAHEILIWISSRLSVFCEQQFNVPAHPPHRVQQMRIVKRCQASLVQEQIKHKLTYVVRKRIISPARTAEYFFISIHVHYSSILCT